VYTEVAGCKAVLRTGDCSNNKAEPGEKPAISDNGNYIVDLHFTKNIADVTKAAEAIKKVVGVVDHGIFQGMTYQVRLKRHLFHTTRTALMSCLLVSLSISPPIFFQLLQSLSTETSVNVSTLVCISRERSRIHISTDRTFTPTSKRHTPQHSSHTSRAHTLDLAHDPLFPCTPTHADSSLPPSHPPCVTRSLTDNNCLQGRVVQGGR